MPSYTVENIDKLHQDANDDYEFEEDTQKEIKPIRYYLQDLRNHIGVAIRKWEDFRDGDFDDLYQYGKKTESDE
jgi:hypothetical protein